MSDAQEAVREWVLAVLREHGDEDIYNNLNLCTIRCSDLNKDIAGIEGNLGMVAVDDWRQ
jgi:hypothetical protein